MTFRDPRHRSSPALPRAGWAFVLFVVLLPTVLLGCAPQPTGQPTASPPRVLSPTATGSLALSASTATATTTVVQPTLPPTAVLTPTLPVMTSTPVWSAAQPREVGFGMTTHFMWYDLGRTGKELDQMQATGFTTARFDVSWQGIEPTRKGDYDVNYLLKLDEVLAALDAHGIAPIITVIETPTWARPPGTGQFYPPTNPQDYADVLRDLARRYADRTGMVWEIWNEPNIPEFWEGGVNVAAYTELLKRAYVAIKAVAPNAIVLGGSIVFNDLKFLRGMYENGAKGFFDGLAVHPYCPGRAPDDRRDPWATFTAVEDMKAVMTALGDSSKTIWITEFGWGLELVTDATRANYLRKAVEMVRAWPYVRAFSVYTLAPVRGSDGKSFALLDTSGTPSKSWTAYTAAVSGR